MDNILYTSIFKIVVKSFAPRSFFLVLSMNKPLPDSPCAHTHTYYIVLFGRRSDHWFGGVATCKVEFWICLLLTFFGYLPGILYAVYAITKWNEIIKCPFWIQVRTNSIHTLVFQFLLSISLCKFLLHI